MNIQIFGTNKCFDTKKAQRYFKERGVRFQMIDLKDALVDWQKEDKLFENQQLFKTPIVRNGRQATVGYQPDVWKSWE